MLEYALAKQFIKDLKRRNPHLILKSAGSFRRKLAQLNDVDVLIVSKANKWPKDSDPISDLKINIISQNNGKTHRLIKTEYKNHNFTCDVTKVDREVLPFALFKWTGDKGEVIGFNQLAMEKGWIFNQYGIWYRSQPKIRVRGSEKIKNEKDIFKFFDKPYKPPEDRSHAY